MFAVHRIDEQLTKAMDRKVWLPSGGTLVIDRTEAMTVVDVNTGKFTGSGGNLEQTVTRNNLEAAEEIVRQLRLRDIGGIVVIDFIDMVLESNRDLVLRRLTEALARDRTRHQVSEVTSLGLGAADPKAVGHRPDRGVFHAHARTAAAGASCCTAIRSTPRRRRAARPIRAGAAASVARRAAEAKMSRSRRCLPIQPVSTRCSRRWPRRTVSTTTKTDGEVEEKTTEDVAELEPDTIREAYVEAEDDELEDEDFDEEDESAEDEAIDEDEIDLDADDEDDDIDDDIEVIDGDSEDDADDSDDSDDDSRTPTMRSTATTRTRTRTSLTTRTRTRTRNLPRWPRSVAVIAAGQRCVPRARRSTTTERGVRLPAVAARAQAVTCGDLTL